MLFGNNCLRGVVQPYICPGPACPPPPPKPKLSSLSDCAVLAKASCKNANFVSFSMRDKVCSWYSTCTFTNSSLRRFAGNGTDYASAVVKGVKGAPAVGSTATGCCGDLWECTQPQAFVTHGDCDKDRLGAWNIYKP